jgi:plastocyanin
MSPRPAGASCPLPCRLLCGLLLCGLLPMANAPAAPVNVSARTADGAGLSDLVVILDPLDASPAPTHAHAIIDQLHKRFVPHISVVRTGTAVTLPNSDQIRHQVYSFSPAKTFNLKLYAGAPPLDVVFDKPGLVVLGCNIHDTMIAFVGVVDTPYFGKTPASGDLTLEVPAGRYRLRLWHPALDSVNAPTELTVGSAAIALPLTLTLSSAGEHVAPWP